MLKMGLEFGGVSKEEEEELEVEMKRIDEEIEEVEREIGKMGLVVFELKERGVGVKEEFRRQMVAKTMALKRRLEELEEEKWRLLGVGSVEEREGIIRKMEKAKGIVKGRRQRKEDESGG